jgi:hypothetical protein
MRGRLWFRDRLYCMADFKDAAELEVLRTMVRRRLEHFRLSTADVAAEIGISSAGLRHVLLGAIPATRVRRALDEWSQDQRPEMASTGAVVLSLAAEMFPMPERTEVRRELAVRLVDSLKRREQSVPPWLTEAASQ